MGFEESSIPALVPRGEPGNQFVCYGDCCSGVPGTQNERNFAAVNAVVARLSPRPEFICFTGDEIVGLTADEDALRAQWDYWFRREMAWLDRCAVPLYHTTGNHTTYDPESERVFREVLAHLPRNGPAGQEGLSYWLRRGDLLMVFVNTTWSGLGGEGRVETEWLEGTLAGHADARFKLVLGHHPVFPVNGFSGSWQREIEPAAGRKFWEVLVRHGVLAYVCSHVLAFDVQVHEGVLQILTAGAGTSGRMPEGIEYLHCVQAAVDSAGLRYQVIDTRGQVREYLSWPLDLPASSSWLKLSASDQPAPLEMGAGRNEGPARMSAFRFTGVCPGGDCGTPQTLLCTYGPGSDLAPLWIGLRGMENRLSVLLSAGPGQSPHLWHGPTFRAGEPFDVQLAVHDGMGPGGFLWRSDDHSPWSSLSAASPYGAERLVRSARWAVGHGQRGPTSQTFRGERLRVSYHVRDQAV